MPLVRAGTPLPAVGMIGRMLGSDRLSVLFNESEEESAEDGGGGEHQ